MNVAIITVSDTVASGERQDASGPAVAARCQELKFNVESTHTLPDDPAQIRSLLSKLADAQNIDVILTTGGTGIGPRDSTPEATQAIAERLVPGMGEEMRRKGLAHTPRAILSRGVAAIRGSTLILNLPGSPKGAVESLDAVAALLPHSVKIIHGARHD
ncbi:MAG TPA: MogA/MoaB family molybdenum cofactor biosynthesis protein [Candidatus Acidoferrum sp.]|nr:MogA/MoaB family molybdenum cofactor biosynthesis protein [Candidatus Acidoferrum sp.]